MKQRFDWDPKKAAANLAKHGVSFEEAKRAFFDPNRVIVADDTHSIREKRYFCFGKASEGILTVRFTLRGSVIRIFGAAYWRKGRRRYEQENAL